MEDKRDCRICGNVSDGTHFGVDSCRACAAFFRRSVVMKKKYVCRQGGEKCFIKKNVRLMCRLCRYMKCVEVGMQPEVVKNKSDDLDALDITLKCEASTSQLEAEIKRDLQSASLERDLTPPSTAILDRIMENYKQLCTVRRAAEQAMWRTGYNQMFAFASFEADIHPANFNLVSRIMRANVPATAEFVNETFEIFGTLAQRDKWLVFQSFVPIFWLLENAYMTYKRFYTEHGIDRFMITQTTYSEVNNPEAFFQPMAQEQSLDLKEIAKLLVKCSDRNIYLAKRLNRANPSEKEFAAAIGLLLWNPNLCDDNEKVQEVAAQERAKILAELHRYYKYEIGLEDYAGRLGEILCLFSTLQWHNAAVRDELELGKLYQLYERDSFIYDIWRISLAQ
ncbi:unnamed protein product, partial [Mesorhabditis spiculigera]